MKKAIIILFFFSMLIMFKNKEEIVIPNNAIRFRIISNSNNVEDQLQKVQIKEELLKNNIFNFNSIEKEEITKELLQKTPSIKKIINNYTSDYTIKYGYNYFPEKKYHGIKYPAGEYESVVITLGEGKGNNWWCVLYPPLCLIDEQIDSYEYTSYVKEIINKYSIN